MFEIRIICDPADTERVTTTLAETFTTGAVRRSPSRTSDKARLYVTAEHREAWPMPEQAYAKAPSIVSEIGWATQRTREALWPLHPSDVREFWLRKAAVLDRIALDDEREGGRSDAAELAEGAAEELTVLDSVTPARGPRAYVRQQYARWAKHQ
ncbi:hypothetical protein ACFC0D_10920 [Streptomyces sp. NPDC056222]|uniref:hypothetical protein n=1 Tax=Streptomyces sp. NPDC056222 TaxID=3345749 RepID=UPI0035E007C4